VCVYVCVQEASNGKTLKSPKNTAQKGGGGERERRVTPLKAVAKYFAGGASAIAREKKPRVHGICESMSLAYVKKNTRTPKHAPFCFYV